MAFIGCCQDMCPVKERQARFGLYMSIFEKDLNNQPDVHSMVKEYRRSGADQEEPSPQDLRTIGALELTMTHLVTKVMDDPRSKQQDTAVEWYDFLWDRLRALRKDITQQNICDNRTALLVGRCARFHVHSCYAMNRVKEFDVDMNKRNLNDCLQMLRQMFTDLRTTSRNINSDELEFQRYDILLHLNDDQLSSTILMKTSDHRDSDEMRYLFKVFAAYTNNDYYRFFKLMEQADYMTSCILSLYANKMRLFGLKSIAHAFSSSRQVTLYPVEMAIKCLGFDGTEDLKSCLESIGIAIHSKDGKEFLALSKDLLTTIRSSEEKIEPFKSYKLVERKMHNNSVGKLVYGGDPNSPVDMLQRNGDSYAPMEAEISDGTDADISSWFQTSQSNIISPPQSSTWLPYTSSFTESFQQDQQFTRQRVTRKHVAKQIVPEVLASSEINNELEQLEQQVIALDQDRSNQVCEVYDENLEPDVPEFLARAIKKRSTMTREQLADMMPAGHFQVAPIASKRPTLKICDGLMKEVCVPQKRKKPSSEPQNQVKSISLRIREEEEVNKLFQDFASMISQ